MTAMLNRPAAGPPTRLNPYMTSPVTHGDVLERGARVFGESPAVVDDETALSYADLWERARALASRLRADGVRSGDKTVE